MKMFKVKSYPAILEKTKKGYSVFFPDLTGAISAGKDYEDAIKQAKECLSLHLYGMLKDKESIPEPTHTSEVMKKLEKNELIALIEPDIFSIKAQQEDKSVRINITLPKSLLEAIDAKAGKLHIGRSLFIQKVAREVL
jgi:predicted RNase H-like HicB family nuclease